MGRLEWIPMQDTPSVISLQKSDVLKCIDDLTEVIYETIPVVGPIATDYNIPALLSIFSVVERREPAGTGGSDFFMELSAFDKSKEKDKEKEIDRIITASYDTAGNIQGESSKDLQSAIAVLKDNKAKLNSLTPESGDDLISPLLQLMKEQRDSLLKQVQHLEETLKAQIEKKDCAQTAPRIALYLLTSAWLFVFNKAVVHLVGFQARSHLISGETDKYVSCMIDWNKEFTLARRHVFTTTYFLSHEDKDNDNKPDGLLVKLHDVRTSKDVVNADGSKITDTWPSTAFGYFQSNPAIKLSLVTDLTGFPAEAKKAAWDLYKASYFRFFDLSVQSIERVTGNWKDCLTKWNRQCPLSPPKYDENNKVIEYIVASAESVSETGYNGPGELRYAVSYVTSRGEGAISEWSAQPTVLEHKESYHVKVDVKVVKQLYYPLAGSERAYTNTRAGNTGKGTETLRRVYVQYTPSGGSSKVSRVLDLRPQDTQFTDKGFEEHLL